MWDPATIPQRPVPTAASPLVCWSSLGGRPQGSSPPWRPPWPLGPAVLLSLAGPQGLEPLGHISMVLSDLLASRAVFRHSKGKIESVSQLLLPFLAMPLSPGLCEVLLCVVTLRCLQLLLNAELTHHQ